MTPIDTATNTPGTPIPVGTTPFGIAITPDGTTAYVTNDNDLTVTAITIANNTPGTPISVGLARRHRHHPRRHNGLREQLSLQDGDPITIATNTPGTPIPVGTNPKASPSPLRHNRLRGRQRLCTMTPITIATNTPGTPIGWADPTGIAITPDGATAYVANASSDSVTPSTIATNTIGDSHPGRQLSTRCRHHPRPGAPAFFTATAAPPGSPTSFDASSLECPLRQHRQLRLDLR